MFGNQGGFSNSPLLPIIPLADDILSNFLQSNTSKTANKKPAPSEERNLLNSMKQNKDPDDDFFSPYNSNSIGKSTKTLAQSHITKKRGGSDSVADLLSEIEQVTADPPTRGNTKAPYSKTMTSLPNNKESISFGGGILDDLADPLDDELGETGYNPSGMDRSKPRRSTTTAGLNDDLKVKRNSVFGLKDNSMDSDGASNNTNKRPLTSDNNKPVTMSNLEDVGDINITVSRRGKRSTTASFGPETGSNRPFTSPGILQKDLHKPDPALSGDDAKSNTDYAYSNIPDFRNPDDDDVASTSEYMSQLQNPRTGTRKNSTGPGVPPKIKIDTSEAGPTRERDGTPNRAMSPISQVGNRDTFFPGLEDTRKDPSRIEASRKESVDMNLAQKSQNVSSEFIPNLAGVSRRKKPDVLLKTDDNVSNAPHKISPRATDLGSPDIGFNQAGSSAQHFFKEGEDLYKKRLKETEEYYEQRFNQLKSSLEEEKKKWEEAHKKEIELLKKEKEELKESMHVNIDRERARLQELHKLEIESKEKLHQYEIERQRHLFEEQNEGLKRQLEAQARLNSLAEEIRQSSSKIHALSDKFEQNKSGDDEKRKQELYSKERALEDRERRLTHDKELMDAERKRLDKLKLDIEQREIEATKGLEKERELLKGEYTRLSDLQESIRNMELEKRKDLEFEKKQLESKKAQIDKENFHTKEDLNKKYHELELQNQLFESRKAEYDDYLARSEESLKQKHEEIDAIRKRMTMSESEIIRKIKNIEQKELIISQQLDDLQSKTELFQMEKLAFEREKLKISDIVSKTKEDTELVNKFKREFEAEKEKNQLLKLELDKYAHGLQNEKIKLEEEKNGINILQKTLEGLRYNYVKDFSADRSALTPVGMKSLQRESFYNANPLGKRTETGFFPASTNNVEEIRDERPPKDPKMELKMRGTFSEKRKDEQNEKYILLKDAKKTEVKSGDIDSGRGSVKSFNLQNYMSQLKEYDKYTTGNQTYITMEKEGLLKNKLDIETGHLNRLVKAPVAEYVTRGSPRYKKKLFTGEEL